MLNMSEKQIHTPCSAFEVQIRKALIRCADGPALTATGLVSHSVQSTQGFVAGYAGEFRVDVGMRRNRSGRG